MKRLLPTSRVHIALGVAVLLHLWLFVDVHEDRWRRLIVPADRAPNELGEGLVIRGNGLGYYAWLRSLLIDHDWDFANEFDEHGVSGDWLPPPGNRTPLGRRPNQWSVGPACVWTVTVVPVHFLLKALGNSSPWAANGYSVPYQLAAGVTSLAVAIIGLFLLYAICRNYARPTLAALATITMSLGSTIVYYSAAEVSMAHGLGAAVLAAMVWYWLKTYGSSRFARWFAVGLLLGAAALIRWQLATFAVLPVGEGLLGCLRTRNHMIYWKFTIQRTLLLLLLLMTGALLVFLPQMAAWQCVYGKCIVEPVPQVLHHWLTPSLWELLASQDRSFFYWTPLTTVALLGFTFCRSLSSRAFLDPSGSGGPPRNILCSTAGSERDSRQPAPAEPLALLLLSLALQVYVLGSVWGKGEFLPEIGTFGGAFLSGAYGMRHLTETVIVLAPGMALLFERARSTGAVRRRWPVFPLFSIMTFSLTLWNLTLVLQYSRGFLPVDAGVAPRALLKNAAQFVATHPDTISLLVEALAVIYLVLLWRSE